MTESFVAMYHLRNIPLQLHDKLQRDEIRLNIIENKKSEAQTMSRTKNSVEYAREIVDRDYIPKILNQTGENSTDKWKSAQRNYSKLKSKNLATINASAIEALKNNSIQLIIRYHNSFFK